MRYLLTILCFIALQANGQALFHAHNTFAPAGLVCSGYDTDACNFITATQLTDATTKSAINTLVVGLKSNSLWTKIPAAYPMSGDGVNMAYLEQARYNLKDTAQYKISWTGTPTATATGVDFDGSTQYGNTGFIISTLPNSNISMGFYSRENVGWAGYDMGNDEPGTAETGLACRWNDDNAYGTANTYGQYLSATVTDSRGFFAVSRTSSTAISLYKNGSLLGSASHTVVSGTTMSAICIGGKQGFSLSNRECAFAVIAEGLTATEVATLNTLIEQFNDALGRGVQP